MKEYYKKENLEEIVKKMLFSCRRKFKYMFNK